MDRLIHHGKGLPEGDPVRVEGGEGHHTERMETRMDATWRVRQTRVRCCLPVCLDPTATRQTKSAKFSTLVYRFSGTMDSQVC